jgi:hypothetical protein
MGPKLNVHKCKVLGCVTMCDRQLCVDCQWCFAVEGTDCYCILYILTVQVRNTIYPTTSSQLNTAHSTHVHANVAVIKLLNFPLE